MLTRRLIAILVTLSIVGSLNCASIAVKKRGAELQQTLDPLIGQSTDAAIMAIGAPSKTEYIAGYDVWYYYFDYGTRHQIILDSDLNVDRMIPRSAYDKIELYFKDGVLKNWKAQIQR